MNPIEFNKSKIKPASERDAPKILERADILLKRTKLEPGEILLIKVSKHMMPHFNDIKNIIDSVFKNESDRVLVYIDGDVTFEKVSFIK